MNGLVFVTAQAADHRHANRLLLFLRDWDYGSGDRFRLVTSKNARDLDLPSDGSLVIATSSPPVDEALNNVWRGASVAEVEAYVLELAGDESIKGVQTGIYILVDDKGLQNRTCVVGERRYDVEAETTSDDFNKVRVPWNQVYSMWCNLDIANMDFEDFTEEDKDSDERGWYSYTKHQGPNLSEKNARKRAEAIESLEREGKA